MGKPLWHDLADRPFGMMLALSKGKTHITEAGIRGLIQLEALKREV
jgi:hypothetical protein